ncbi:MAG TPA: flagellar basal body P-ring formation chaperone FlgA [Thermodesulfobacteriota bacterium]|nr:flagellar basal body P-ring formation chaperone FlgA [Thermodesulfobacteriota bacterium]
MRDVHGWDGSSLPAGPVTWEVRAPERFSQGGNLSVLLTAVQEGKKVRDFRVAARVEVYADVVAARNYLPRHHLVEEKDLHMVKKNVTLQPQDFITDVKDAAGKRTTLAVNHQETLRKSMLETPPIVKKGDRVNLIIEKNNFQITAAGEVREEGREGDRVRVMNTSSRKEVSGKVLDAKTVQVDF